jgi:O-methyltransferase
MKNSLIPGRRIQALPKFFHPAAVLVRNILISVGLLRELKAERPDLRIGSYKSLALGVDYVYGCAVDGDIAEFGTMTGATAFVLAREMKRATYMYPLTDPRGRPKNLYLFDSFQGLPKSDALPDVGSPHVMDGTWSAGTCRGITKDDLTKKCGTLLSSDRVFVFDGWFKNTLSQLSDAVTFSLMHIDCDLYSSTMDVLEYAFHNGIVEEGCAIFFDDWNSNKASPKYGERKAWAEVVERFSIEYSDWGEYGHMGRKFIVHSYIN